MTGLLIQALQGLEDETLDREGNIEIGSLYSYLRDKMPEKQNPDLAGKFGPYRCIIASYPHLAEHLRIQTRENELKTAHETELMNSILSTLFQGSM